MTGHVTLKWPFLLPVELPDFIIKCGLLYKSKYTSMARSYQIQNINACSTLGQVLKPQKRNFSPKFDANTFEASSFVCRPAQLTASWLVISSTLVYDIYRSIA